MKKIPILKLFFLSLSLLFMQNTRAQITTLPSTIDFLTGNGTDLGTEAVDGEGGSSDITGYTFKLYVSDDAGTATGGNIYYDTSAGYEGLAASTTPDLTGYDGLVLELTSGGTFDFNGFTAAEWTSNQTTITVEGFKNSVSTGSVTLTLGALAITSYGTSDLPNAKFGDVDKVLITGDAVGSGKFYGTLDAFVVAPVVDATPPSVSSISLSGSPADNATSVTYAVTFDENASNISTDDFQVTSVSGTANGSVSAVSGSSGTSVNVTVNSISGTGSIRLDLKSNTNIIDDSGNGNGTNGNVAAFTSGDTHTVDTDPPSVSSISVSGSPAANATSVSYNVSFSENVTGVDASDFSVYATGVTGSITGISGSGSSYTVTVGSVSGTGTLRIDLNSSGTGIADLAGNAISGGFTAGATHTVDTDAPTVSSIAVSGSPAANATSVSYNVLFSEKVTGVDASDFSVNGSGVTGSITGISGSGSSYTVTVGSVSGTGALSIDLNSSGTGITDSAGNAISGGFTAGATHTVDTEAPSGFTVTISPSPINNGNKTTVAFTFGGAEVGSTYNYVFTTDGGSGSVSSSGTITSSNQTVNEPNVQFLQQGTITISVTLTDAAGNVSSPATDTEIMDLTVPTVNSFSPADGATNIATNSNLTITFGENIHVGSGNILIKKISDNSTVQSIAVTDNSQVSVSGAVVTINPTTDLAYNTAYYVQIPATAFTDDGGNAYAGISDNSTWNFTTAIPVLVTVNDPSVSEGNSGTTNLTFTVSLSKAAPAGGATVDYATSNGTATSGSDYTSTSGTLTFAAGETSKTVDVPVSGDQMLEPNETVNLTLSNATGTNVVISDATAFGIINNDDAAAVTIADVSGNEDDGPITVTATLDHAVQGGFTVDVSTADGTATTADKDYTPVLGHTLRFAGTAGETQTFTITPISDTKLESNETVSVSQSNLALTALTVDITDGATITINNDDAAAVTIADVSGNEDNGAITVTATLDHAVQGGFTVDVNTVDGTATTADNDYTAVSGHTLTFTGTAGETKTFTVTPTSDTKLESNETVSVSQSNLALTSLPVNITDGATVTINNDDAAAVTIANVSGNEDNGAITLTATLDHAVQGGFAVDVNTADGTAKTADNDYTAVSGQTLTFTGTAGERQTFTVTPTSDTKLESNETVSVSQSNLASTSLPVNITDGAMIIINNDDAAAVSIANASGNEDDGAITLTATLDHAVQGGFTVDVSTADGTATIADNDYTPVFGHTLTFAGTAGETQTFTVTPTSDTKPEANETVSVSQSNLAFTALSVDITDRATITINDDDAATVTIADISGNEDDGPITVTATLDRAVAGGFTVDVNTADGTATTADNDYTAVSGQTLTFTGTAGETQTFTVTPTSDAKLEADETFSVSQSNLAATAVPVNITDGATVTINNDDTAAVTIADASGNEDGGAITLTATLDYAVQGGFTVDVSTADGTATIADNDYTAVPGQTLTFAGTAGETQTFTVTPTSDTKLEADETFSVSQSNLASTSLPVDITDGATVTINNDDAAVLSNIDGDHLTIQTGGSAGNIDVGGNAVISNADIPDFNGGNMAVSQSAGTANGSFSLTGSGSTGVASGSSAGTADGTIAGSEIVYVDGVAIGTVDASSDGQSGNNLQISFNSNSTTARVQDLLRSLMYAAPSGPGDRTFTITLISGGSSSTSGSANVTVTVLSPGMDLFQGTAAIAAGGTYDFGNQKVNTSIDTTYTVENNGTGALSLTTPIVLSGTDASDFSIVQQPGAMVAASSSTTFVVRFTPSSTGTKTVKISIANNSTTENPYVLNLQGSGISVPAVTTLTAQTNNATYIIGGNVTDNGNSAITERGVVYSATNRTLGIGEPNVTQQASGSGTGTFHVTLSSLNPGTVYYYAAYATNHAGTTYGVVESFTTDKEDQTITFSAMADKTFGDADFDPMATASSGLNVTYSSSDQNVATIVGNKVHVVGAGSCQILADQAGNASYNAAPQVRQTLTVKKAQALVVVSDTTGTYDKTQKPVTVTTTPSGLSVDITYDGSPAVPSDAGTYDVVAKVDNDNYAGFGSASLVIAKAAATVGFDTLETVYNGNPKPVPVTTSPAGLSVDVAYNGSFTVPADSGKYVVIATITDPNYTGSATSEYEILADTDLDGIPNIIDPDDDNDDLTDIQEIAMGTDPLNPDTDGDGVHDKYDPQPLLATAIDNRMIDKMVKAFPTVTHDEVHIRIDKTKFDVALYSLQGVLLKQINGGLDNVTLHTGGYRQGMYILKIKVNHTWVTRRVIREGW